MVNTYEASMTVEVDTDSGLETATGRVEVVMDVPIEVTAYDSGEITDAEIESKAIEAIQEGKARVLNIRPTVRSESSDQSE